MSIWFGMDSQKSVRLSGMDESRQGGTAGHRFQLTYTTDGHEPGGGTDSPA